MVEVLVMRDYCHIEQCYNMAPLGARYCDKHTPVTDLPTDNPETSKESFRGAITEVGGGQTETDGLWQIILTLTDAIATLERKFKHKEITYDEYEIHSKRYEQEAFDKLQALSHHQTEQVLSNMIAPIKSTGTIQSMTRGEIISWFEAELKRLRRHP
jgi:uncharacterized damage-inducible protein DinB